MPWGFDPADIAVPVRWWHGLDDQTVPFAEVEAMTGTIPDATVSHIPDAGHLLLAAAADDIVSALASDPDRSLKPDRVYAIAASKNGRRRVVVSPVRRRLASAAMRSSS